MQCNTVGRWFLHMVTRYSVRAAQTTKPYFKYSLYTYANKLREKDSQTDIHSCHQNYIHSKKVKTKKKRKLEEEKNTTNTAILE